MDKYLESQRKTLKVISGKETYFQLGGGTALSLFYFQHRESYDLDFFSTNFSKKTTEIIVSDISSALTVRIDLIKEINIKDAARVLTYQFQIDRKQYLKIDFIEDVFRRLKNSEIFNGIPVLSKEDIYLRKIFASCGINIQEETTGREKFLGGRQSAKDFFDLYYLSYTFMNLSRFAQEYCNHLEKESIISWYGSYKRQNMKLDLLEIRTDKDIDFVQMERHFKLEIAKLIKMDLKK